MIIFGHLKLTRIAHLKLTTPFSMKREECDVGSGGMVYDKEGTQEWNEYFGDIKGDPIYKNTRERSPKIEPFLSTVKELIIRYNLSAVRIHDGSNYSQSNLGLLPEKVRESIIIHYGDLTDANFFAKLLQNEKPDELYHLAAQSFVGYSFQNPSSTYDVNISGTLNVVNAIKDYSPATRMYFAASSEMYGQPETLPQNENTPFKPRSPYAISKLAGFWTAKTYRDAYGLFISNGISFNHESEVGDRSL